MTTHRILILGGGFGGVYAARRLDQIFAHRDDVEITLLSGENFLLFTPMLAEVVSSSIEASHIISPIRAFFRRVRFQNSEVKSIDLERRVVTASHCIMCGSSEFPFDHLVLALGSTTEFHPLLTTLPCGRNRRGQLITNPYMSVPGYLGLWALGDCARFPTAAASCVRRRHSSRFSKAR
jgi:NADH dehydrogenase FAD-containing subunit